MSVMMARKFVAQNLCSLLIGQAFIILISAAFLIMYLRRMQPSRRLSGAGTRLGGAALERLKAARGMAKQLTARR
jgi:hypothetical protein